MSAFLDSLFCSSDASVFFFSFPHDSTPITQLLNWNYLPLFNRYFEVSHIFVVGFLDLVENYVERDILYFFESNL